MTLNILLNDLVVVDVPMARVKAAYGQQISLKVGQTVEVPQADGTVITIKKVK